MENSNEQLMIDYLKYNKVIKQRQEAVKRYNNKNREKITLQVKINLVINIKTTENLGKKRNNIKEKDILL